MGLFLLSCDLRAGHRGSQRHSAARLGKARSLSQGCRAHLLKGEVRDGRKSPCLTVVVEFTRKGECYFCKSYLRKPGEN